ncbi:alpha/beta fold hydrolase [Corticibacter populi]|uniref:Alpha/beta fold hydrolase n=1 Tax=Corticibacter populi TaxID=1550736 RepID=A0A3M6R092_9BURK|nr:alpha/beta fold hydrolase [Corticibacter populi]RMX08299.1 alpha/beta fold hydrolase [Corticibacter populi]RZS35581.1 polyhydroxyalkanoate synthase [Corticibacter populi]
MPRPPHAPGDQASDASQAAWQLDALAHAAWARMNASVSPQSVWLAWFDWASHLAISPGKRLELLRLAQDQREDLLLYLRQYWQADPAQRADIEPPISDKRFRESEWRQWPFNLLLQAYLMAERWWQEAGQGVWGVEKHHENLVNFWAHQLLQVLSPANYWLSNPVVLAQTRAQAGANLSRGLANWLDASTRQLAHLPPPGAEDFVVGRDVAATPGKVILRNDVMELIQYAPSTGQVHPEPVLVVPAWIMKYYILDLSPGNSLVRYLVGQGYTVFCISWKNPGEAEGGLGMEDYLQQGLFAALDAVQAVVPGRKVHATGYCLGGTLLAIGAAALVRDGDERLASLSLFTAQTDFSEPGELALFIDESQVSLLEAQMKRTGYLRSDQMAGAFQMLRSYDMIWSRMVREYLLGERGSMNDLMAWNADATRMPARMHSQYLRRLFLDNDLSSGRYEVGGKPISLADIALPIFNVGTLTDHVAPWHSVYKLHNLTPAEITFVLTSGGHNAGIVSEIGHPHRSYQIHTRRAGGRYRSADDWQAAVPVRQGSWWPEWAAWLQARSGAPGKPPRMGAARRGYRVLQDAPGSYVLEK